MSFGQSNQGIGYPKIVGLTETKVLLGNQGASSINKVSLLQTMICLQRFWSEHAPDVGESQYKKDAGLF